MAELGGLLSEDEIMAFVAIMDVNNDGVVGVSVMQGWVPEWLAVYVLQGSSYSNHRSSQILGMAVCLIAAVSRILAHTEDSGTQIHQHKRAQHWRGRCGSAGQVGRVMGLLHACYDG